MKKRAGFTMIELIFVIVILGILAAVAIPKLAATRDDAQISKIVTNITTTQSEISGYTLSQGSVPVTEGNLTVASNVVAAGLATGYITTAAGTAPAVWTISFFDSGETGHQLCATIDLNSTTMTTKDNNATTPTNICAGVIGQIVDSNISLAGQKVVY